MHKFTYDDAKFENTQVQLADSKFINCTFNNCTIIFNGNSNFSFVGCGFSNCKWIFDGQAAETLLFLKALYNGLGDGGKKIVNEIFEDIKK